MFKPLVAVGAATGDGNFALDQRFWPDAATQGPPADEEADPAERARIEGYQQGWDDAAAFAAQASAAQDAARAALARSFTRLDSEQTARLAERLRETVEALCDELIADIAIDRALLSRRAEAAAALLATAENNVTFHLNPDDLALVGDQFTQSWTVLPDPTRERGAIRIDNGDGGVEDGPGNWRRAVTEALRTC